MTVPPEIEQMVQGSETISVEFKKELTKDFPEHIMAFANRYGGHILVGVKGKVNSDGSQTGQIVGFQSANIDADKQKVDNWARSLRPVVTLLVNEKYQLPNEHWLLHIKVEEQPEKPVGTAAGLYKIRTHSGTSPMDHSAIRAAVFEGERTLKSLRESLRRNVAHAEGIVSSMGQSALPLTVFEKAPLISALSSPNLYENLDQRELSAAYQAYEIVDRLVWIMITWRPMGGQNKDVVGLIQNHAHDARTRSSNLLERIDQLLK